MDVTLPDKTGNIAAVAMGTNVYLFGGDGYGHDNNFDAIRVFDTTNNSFTTLDTKLPIKSYGFASAIIGTKIYLFGGEYYSSGYRYLNTINVFDTENNMVTTLDITIPTALHDIASAVIGTTVYLFGGSGSGQTSYVNTINKFIVQLPLPTNKLLIETAIGKNLVKLISGEYNSMKIGINNVYIGNANGYAEKVPAAIYTDGAWTEI